MKIILKNIIDNAIKYSPDNSLINIEILDDSNFLFVKIKDEGQGIKAEDLEKLNRATAMVKNIEKNSYGLGLQICFYFAKEIGIKLNFESIKEKGTAVRVGIPK